MAILAIVFAVASAGTSDNPHHRDTFDLANAMGKVPELRAMPLWEFVTPPTMQKGAFVDEDLTSYTDDLAPVGQRLEEAFPNLRLRDFPLLRALPSPVPEDFDWSQSVAAAFPRIQRFLPQYLRVTPLKDVRFGDLEAISVHHKHHKDGKKDNKEEKPVAHPITHQSGKNKTKSKSAIRHMQEMKEAVEGEMPQSTPMQALGLEPHEDSPLATHMPKQTNEESPITVDSLGSGMHRWVDSDTAAGFVKDYSKEHDRELHVHELGEGSEQLDELAKMQQSQQSQQKVDRQTLKAIESDDLVEQVSKQSTAVMSDMQVQVQTLNKASELLDNGKAFLGRQREVLLAMAKDTATKRERQEKLLAQEEAQEREVLQLRRQIEDQQRQIAKTRRVSHTKTAKLKELKQAAKDAEASLLKQNEKTQEVRTKNLQLLNQTRALTTQLQSKQADNQKLEEEDLKRDEADDED
mmetsp:Transcript_14094/g.31255  ORF Transcript_14094/g.31255 Transcript_14094/m.31255 type:complete len:464 (-) Transcript_14094:52-1443(-)|eukprot:CAMPEP_0204277940 /NCGR_PEP_ID=MMETSP0468-20130131/29590_1 /ASSEMBLY_ACC=CAM_ASM_000383 /TAXON_ID=2969 /ORGANISM="Oxyrrhis marina" /LENGTH=463 /DNA_ID=CAMNT_0051254793 /DNA_START=95 /DNA_END=1486 /DNA_ORIENTATION=+